jgi:alanine racemase
MRHLACSAAALLFKRTHLELVRIGVSFYGFWPSRETMVSMKNGNARGIGLQPALSWKTRLAQVKEVPAGTDVGYGCTYRTTRRSRLAVIPVGYYDGYDRGLSNAGHVLVRGRRAPIRGRVCMNMTIVDVTDIPDAVLEDEAVLIGRQGDELITADMLAGYCGTIHYEIVSRIHPEIPRVLVD